MNVEGRASAQFCFGPDTFRLSREQEVGAPFDDRLRSVWPYLVRTVKRFGAGLAPRERSNYGDDDLLNEVAMALWRKDGKWSPARGRYITFSEQVCRSTLLGLRSRMKTIHSPANGPGHVRDYVARQAAGTLKPRQVEILGRLRQVLGPVDDLADLPSCPQLTSDADPVVAAASAREESGRAVAAARVALAAAGPLEALLLTRLHGLFGRPPQSAGDLAGALPGWTARRVLMAAHAAEEQIRRGADPDIEEEDGS